MTYRELGRAIFGLIGLLVLFLAVRAVRATPALTWVAVVLGGPVVLLTVAEAVWPDNEPDRLLERPAARALLLLHGLRPAAVHVRRQLGDP